MGKERGRQGLHLNLYIACDIITAELILIVTLPQLCQNYMSLCVRIRTIDRLEAADLVAAGSRQVVAKNGLAIVGAAKVGPISTPVDLLSTMITPQNPAVLVRDFKTDKTFIITRSDVIRVL